ncbi:hypothetical protein [Mycolicibacter acidiphilus]|uniref:hypothetical protein n=1 Tax=Mycolicibacter acidiphilus TaxID=2835306 RepID=UPI002022E174|nr:hypothetical protein [Mycolicibacter acidiphilus]
MIVAALAIAPPAATEPQFPDLGRFTAVNAAEYGIPIPSDGPYPGAQTGVAFGTPSGQNCSIWINVRGMWAAAYCNGPIPGRSQTSVSVGTTAAGEFRDSAGSGDGQSTLLPVGHKIEFTRRGYVGTCAADTAMTACVVDYDPPSSPARHGFVLGPQESWTF